MRDPSVFISYSHNDEEWKNRLVTQLKVLQMEDMLRVWDDSNIQAGADSYQEIETAMAEAAVAVLLISADFLTSDFIRSEEVPTFLRRREEEGLTVFPVIVKPCAWQQVEWLARMQVRPRNGRPISAGDDYQQDKELAAIAKEIADIIS